MQPETYFPYFTKACLSKAEEGHEWQNIVIITKSGNNNGSIVFEVETFYGSFSLFSPFLALALAAVKKEPNKDGLS